MAITWSDYRERVRRTILDDPDLARFSDENLLDAVGWALDTLCAHTALTTSVSLTGVTGSEVALPSDLYGSLEQDGTVYIQTSATLTALAPAYHASANRTDVSFVQWGSTLYLSAPLSAATDLLIRYFAYYPHPVDDNDEILAPEWALGPMGHLVGAYALSGKAVTAGGIGQFRDKTDAGNPEHNPLLRLSFAMVERYDHEIRRFPAQQRGTAFGRAGTRR